MNTADVKLNGSVINGDLFMTQGIGDRDVFLMISASGYGISEVQQQVKTAAAKVALHKTVAASTGSQPTANAID